MTGDTYLNDWIAENVLRVYIVVSGFVIVHWAGMVMGVLESL